MGIIPRHWIYLSPRVTLVQGVDQGALGTLGAVAIASTFQGTSRSTGRGPSLMTPLASWEYKGQPKCPHALSVGWGVPKTSSNRLITRYSPLFSGGNGKLRSYQRLSLSVETPGSWCKASSDTSWMFSLDIHIARSKQHLVGFKWFRPFVPAALDRISSSLASIWDLLSSLPEIC